MSTFTRVVPGGSASTLPWSEFSNFIICFPLVSSMQVTVYRFDFLLKPVFAVGTSRSLLDTTETSPISDCILVSVSSRSWDGGYVYTHLFILCLLAKRLCYGGSSTQCNEFCRILYIVAYRPVARQRFSKQWPLLGNALNIHASDKSRTVFSMWFTPRPLLRNGTVNAPLQK
jgi:hypothetical protein